MNYEEYVFLTSEIKELEVLLSQIPAEDVIDRLGFENRLKAAREKVANFDPDKLPQKARLTFRGKPVFGSHGIAADFASKAAQCFSDAFSAIVAEPSLHYKGPIPDKQKNQLVITGTALGSFGFEFELPVSESSEDPKQTEFLPVENKAVDAMEKLEELFQSAATGSDDDIAELVDEIHPRAVEKAANFLEFISNQGAWCGLEIRNHAFRFSGVDAVRSSATRLKSGNIKENRGTFWGEFQGILPKERSFEFKLNDQTGVLKGKIGLDIEEPGKLNELLNKPVNIELHIIQVGNGRPRFTLQNLDSIKK